MHADALYSIFPSRNNINISTTLYLYLNTFSASTRNNLKELCLHLSPKIEGNVLEWPSKLQGMPRLSQVEHDGKKRKNEKKEQRSLTQMCLPSAVGLARCGIYYP